MRKWNEIKAMKEKDKNNDNLSINWFVAEEDFSDNKKKINEAA